MTAIASPGSPPRSAAIANPKAALIEVEDSLDSQLVKLILPDAAAPSEALGEPTDAEFRQVQDAVLRECIVNVARIKEAITQALGAPAEAQGLDQVPQLVRGITAWLSEREYTSVAQMKGSLSQQSCPDPDAFERANYMQALQPWRP